VGATADVVFEFLRDYRGNRPRILPGNFSAYRVEHGGRGDGTTVTYRLHAGPRERGYRMRVSEPAGQTLVERDQDSSLVTTWTVLPSSAPARSRVTVTTEWQGAGGIGGFFESRFAPSGLRRIYDDMLGRLAAAVEGGAR